MTAERENWTGMFAVGTKAFWDGRVYDANDPACPAAATLLPTDAQHDKIVALGGDPDTFHPTFDLPDGYVAGWAKGVYYGVDLEGQASS